MERENFDDSWKKAFEQSEVAPSENVWTNIALDLERAKGSKLKKRLVIFQLLAAASIVFAMGLGVGVYIMKNSYEDAANQLAARTLSTEKPSQVNPSAANAAQAPAVQQSDRSNVRQQPSSITTITPADDKTSTKNSGRTLTAQSSETEQVGNAFANEITATAYQQGTTDRTAVFGAYPTELAATNDASLLPELYNNREVKLALPTPKKAEVDPVQLMLARLEQRELEVREGEETRKPKEQRSEKLWTSVGFAAGSFTSANAGVSDRKAPMAFSQNSTIANNEAKASGVSYTVGANIGTKLSDRWVFQGGVNYLTQSSDYTTRAAVISSADAMSFRPASINELDKMSTSDVPSEEQIVSTVPYNVNNNLRYLSIPMQAGYLLVNRNFGLQLNAGVATDVFLQNTVTAEGQNFDKTQQDIGEHSPYRSVNLSGLAGTEISYRFSKNYRIALNPGVRYPFSSIYRSELAVKSSPITFDIGLRFRYIFH